MTQPDSLFSTFPAVRDRLLVQIKEYLADAPVDERTPPVALAFGDPGEEIPDRYVSVLSTRGPINHTIKRVPHDASSSVDEAYVVEVVLWRIVRGGHEPADGRRAFVDVFDLAQRIDAGLRRSHDDWDLGGLVTSCHVADLTPDDYSTSDGRASQIVLGLAVDAKRI